MKSAPLLHRPFSLPLKTLAAALCLSGFLLSLTGCGPDTLKGYYALQVSAVPDATPEKQQMSEMVFGFERLALNEDHTFRLGKMYGNWSRSGDRVTLEPTTKPAAQDFYAVTSMGPAISIMLDKTEFQVSSDEKKLTAVNPIHGPLVFSKTGDGLK